MASLYDNQSEIVSTPIQLEANVIKILKTINARDEDFRNPKDLCRLMKPTSFTH